MRNKAPDLEQKVQELEKQVAYLKGLSEGAGRGVRIGYEYKSKRKILGMPLVHINQGLDPKTGAPAVARGFVAIGNIAIGVFAFGGLSLGVFTLGGIAMGLLSFGGISIGIGLALGGVSIGYVAIGGLAIGKYAVGGMALGVHTISARGVDPRAVEFFKSFVPAFLQKAGTGMGG
ncbi:MAG: hypothetical protein GXP49_07605 [Deltaproteobacteria bacterium]|nr:hypothetical protein [Deltaproteobacteria bacterium]